MILKFTTKRDANGNRKTLIIYYDTMEYERGYNTAHCYDDYITITARDRLKIIGELDNAGFIELY